MTNSLWFSLGSTLAIPPYVIVYWLLKENRELLNKLLEKNGLTPLGEETREKPPAPEMPKRKMSFPMRMP